MPLVDSLWRYGLIFGTLFMTGIGLPPAPEELPIIGAGIAANQQAVYWWLAWPMCIVGVVSADLVLYGVGRFWGKRLFQYPLVQRFLPPERRDKIEKSFHSHGVKILLTARLLPGLRTGVFTTAGAMHYPFIRFLIADGIYAIPGVGLVFFGSYWLAESFERLINEIHNVQNWLLVCGLVVAGIYAFYRYVRFRRERGSTDNYEPPTLTIHLGHHANPPGATPHPPDPMAVTDHSPDGAPQRDPQLADTEVLPLPRPTRPPIED